MNLWLLLETAASMHPHRRAATQDGKSETFEELVERAQQRASWIRKNAASCPVIYVGQNRLEFIEILFGCVLAGVPLVPVNFRVKISEYEHFLRVSRARLVIAERRYHETILAAVECASLDVAVHEIDAGIGATASPSYWIEPEATAVALFTSGTTSAPKLVRLTHQNLSSYVIETVAAGSAANDEAAILSAPVYHVAAIANILTSIFRARRLVLLPQFEASRWLEDVKQEAVTHAMVVPTMLGRILDALDENPDMFPSSLQNLAYGGAKAPETLVRRALHRFPDVDFVNAFGLTETSSTVALLGPEDHRAAISSADASVQARLASVGRPVPGVEIQIRLANGAIAPTGTPGQICIRGPQVAAGYVGETLDIDESGWLRTGDIGYFDGFGFLFMADRSDDVIIRGGENISPSEVEDVLRLHEAVRDVVVVGIPDLEWGEVIIAGYEGDSVPAEELQAWARERLAGYKVPRLIYHVEKLPRTDMGKLLRREVRETFS